MAIIIAIIRIAIVISITVTTTITTITITILTILTVTTIISITSVITWQVTPWEEESEEMKAALKTSGGRRGCGEGTVWVAGRSGRDGAAGGAGQLRSGR